MFGFGVGVVNQGLLLTCYELAVVVPKLLESIKNDFKSCFYENSTVEGWSTS